MSHVVYELFKLVRERQLYAEASRLEDHTSYDSFEAYFCAVMGKPFDTWLALAESAACPPHSDTTPVRPLRPYMISGTGQNC